MSALIDWGLAARIARFGAGPSAAVMAPGSGLDLEAAGARAELAVLEYTGLRPREPMPRCEWVSRADWAEANLRSMRELLAPLERRIGDSAPAAARGIAGGVLGRVVAIEVGGLLALGSRRVLAQYELTLRGADRAPRLLFVGANIEAAARELDGEPAAVLDWIAAHEVTHAVHFAAAPWLRGHLGGLLETLMAETELGASAGELLGRARRLAGRDPRRLLRELRRSDPVTLLAPAASRDALASIQATMAAIEGYAEHVMDAAERTGGGVTALRAGLERRRESRGALARAISWLLGFELKLRQYRDGKRFADAVVDRAGIGALNRAWDRADALPSLAELADVDAWLARTAAPAAA